MMFGLEQILVPQNKEDSGIEQYASNVSTLRLMPFSVHTNNSRITDTPAAMILVLLVSLHP